MSKYVLKKVGIIFVVMSLLGCTTKNQQSPLKKIETNHQANGSEIMINIKIEDYDFTVEVYDNETSQAFIKRLPLTVQMNELNGNEKYVYLDQNLPTHEESIHSIQSGHLMLFGNNCLVLFYEDFDSPYQYTPIGKIETTTSLQDIVGRNSIEVTISQKSE